MIVLISFFVLVSNAWVGKLESEARAELYADLESHVCGCLDIISDNNQEIVLMNVNCLFVENLTMINGDEVHEVSEVLYYEDFAVISYNFQPLFFTFNYNNCTEMINK